MVILKKFYFYLKSIYLSDSKYSNNLRHLLYVFLKRHIKGKYLLPKTTNYLNFRVVGIRLFFKGVRTV